jgi:hypothetical protein
MGSMNRSLAGGDALKALSLTKSGVSDAFSGLLDHLIRSSQHIRRDRKADLLGGF